MLTKKSRKLIFVETTILILIIYAIIMSTTYIMDIWRINSLDLKIQTQNIRYESYAASKSFYHSMGLENCEFSRELITEDYKKLRELGIDINSYKNRMLKINEKNHEIKKREYLIAQAENLNKLQIHNENCEQKIYFVLYFIDGEITGFNEQALILQQFLLNHKDEIITYTIDINFKEEFIVNALMTRYNITKHNTIILGNYSNSEEGQTSLAKLTSEFNKMRNN
ncbi:MAG: hypothetical protein ACLFN8_01670 [Candidatus Woesearchaeota archaeon]